MLIAFLVFICCLFLVFGAYLLATRGSDARRVRLRQRLEDVLLHSAHTEDVDVLLVRARSAMRLKRLLDQADLQITVTRLLMLALMAGILAALAVSMLTVSMLLIVVAG